MIDKKKKLPKSNHAGNPLEIIRPRDAQVIEDSLKLAEGLQYLLRAMGVTKEELNPEEQHIMLNFTFTKGDKHLRRGHIDINFMHGECEAPDDDGVIREDFLIL